MLIRPCYHYSVRIEAIKIKGAKPVNLTGLIADDVVNLVESEHFTWIDIEITDSTDDAALGKLLIGRLDFHPATVSDCLRHEGFHQPKMDEEQDYRFVTFIYYEPQADGKLKRLELYSYVGTTYVITIHNHSCKKLMDEIRDFPRVITDYEQRAILFMHHVLDMVVDTYTPLLRSFGHRADDLEISVLKASKKRKRKTRGLSTLIRKTSKISDMREILKMRRSLVHLRRTLTEEEEIVDRLVEEYDYEGAPEASEEIAIYFRDISDHLGKYLEIIEGLDSSLNHLMEVHALLTGQRTNEIIFLLTIISTIMLPLNLIVGFFGMNFDNLWFSHVSWGIWIVTGFMFAIVAGLFFYFRNKGWI